MVSQLRGDYIICNPEEVGSVADAQGAISIAPPMRSVVDDYEHVNNYHAWFILFLALNHDVLAACGADDLRIFMEIFYQKGQQCNLEVFDRESISVIGKYNVALPISIYALSEADIHEWAREIKATHRPE